MFAQVPELPPDRQNIVRVGLWTMIFKSTLLYLSYCWHQHKESRSAYTSKARIFTEDRTIFGKRSEDSLYYHSLLQLYTAGSPLMAVRLGHVFWIC